MTGFNSPNYTQAPNDLFDTLMKDMSEAELKVVMVAIRKTFGYHKNQDAISFTQFQEMTGLSRQSVADGIEAAVKRGVLKIDGHGKRGVNIYSLVVILDQSENKTSTSQENGLDSAPTSLKSRHTKETKSKENKQKNSPKPPKGAGKTQSPEIETAIDSIITAYLESTQTIDPHALKNKSKRTDALFMHQQGVKPTLVQEWGKFVRAQDFWKTRAISWRKFAAEILPFKSSYIPRVMIVPAVLFEPAPERAAHDEVIPDTEKEELRQMFEALVNAKDANDVKYS